MQEIDIGFNTAFEAQDTERADRVCGLESLIYQLFECPPPKYLFH